MIKALAGLLLNSSIDNAAPASAARLPSLQSPSGCWPSVTSALQRICPVLPLLLASAAWLRCMLSLAWLHTLAGRTWPAAAGLNGAACRVNACALISCIVSVLIYIQNSKQEQERKDRSTALCHVSAGVGRLASHSTLSDQRRVQHNQRLL